MFVDPSEVNDVDHNLDRGFLGVREDLLGIQTSMLVDIVEAQRNGTPFDIRSYLEPLTALKARYDRLVSIHDLGDSSVWSLAYFVRALGELGDTE